MVHLADALVHGCRCSRVRRQLHQSYVHSLGGPAVPCQRQLPLREGGHPVIHVDLVPRHVRPGLQVDALPDGRAEARAELPVILALRPLPPAALVADALHDALPVQDLPFYVQGPGLALHRPDLPGAALRGELCRQPRRRRDDQPGQALGGHPGRILLLGLSPPAAAQRRTGLHQAWGRVPTVGALHRDATPCRRALRVPLAAVRPAVPRHEGEQAPPEPRQVLLLAARAGRHADVEAGHGRDRRVRDSHCLRGHLGRPHGLGPAHSLLSQHPRGVCG
mmetsp:Transcript_99653/g.264849  ORF Transcript_99653/g.264849 Transcript_99653/m.264849 type:complete len:278 (+) Transcript_99653:585-1418(+)